MTRDDTIRLLDKICRLYITQARKMSSEEKAAMLSSWEETFTSDSYDEVLTAVNNYVRKGNAFMPLPGDIIKELTAVQKTTADKPYTEVDRLFKKLVDTADMLANGKERISILDPGGFRWDPELKRNVYHHAETVQGCKSYTQHDFAALPPEIQEYVEDIEGLKDIWHEIQSSRELARRRFEKALPGIKTELAKRDERLIRETEERKKAMYS